MTYRIFRMIISLKKYM